MYSLSASDIVGCASGVGWMTSQNTVHQVRPIAVNTKYVAYHDTYSATRGDSRRPRPKPSVGPA